MFIRKKKLLNFLDTEILDMEKRLADVRKAEEEAAAEGNDIERDYRTQRIVYDTARSELVRLYMIINDDHPVKL